jgi:hypothetical protein
MIEHCIEVKREVERLMIRNHNRFTQRAVQIPEREAAQWVSVSVDAGTKLDITEIIVHRLRIGAKIERGATKG